MAPDDSWQKLNEANARIQQLERALEAATREREKDMLENIELRSALKTVRDVAIGRVGK